jgi:hypothetical protein
MLQIATDASDNKRVQVLQIREASTTNEGSVKKSKTAAAIAKKKVVKRKAHGETRAAANEGAPNPNTPVRSAMAAVAPTTPARNDTLTPSTE